MQINYGGGAGHGGVGGNSSGAGSGGPAYGYTNAPGAGSGGAEGASGGLGGNGGGQIRVEATDTILINGTVTANGEAGGYYAGGGSGGGIWLSARRFRGSGVMRANGGNSNKAGGAAGGGRIALWSGGPYLPDMRTLLAHDQAVRQVQRVATFDDLKAALTVANGSGGHVSSKPQPGTIALLHLPPPCGTMLILR